MSSPTASNYVLGQSAHEYERLMLQSRMLRPYIEKFFHAAGLAPRMRVLDVGSGMGDLLSADIGPGGRSSVSTATPQGCSSWVEFQPANLMNLRLRIASTP